MYTELEDLPRRVYSQSFQRQGPTEGSESKVIGQIPPAITHRSTNNKQPGLKPSYAGINPLGTKNQDTYWVNIYMFAHSSLKIKKDLKAQR